MTDDLSFLRAQARTQRFTLGTPRQFQVTPDGERVLFLRSESGHDRRNSLWQLDVASGEESKLVDVAELLPGEEDLPAEERARRERARETSGGVVGYATDAAGTVAAFSLSGRLYTADLTTGGVRMLVDAAVLDPRPNPQGSHVAYVADRRLHVVDLATGEDRVVAGPEATENEDVGWGVAEFIAAEEMRRVRGYWWSPDGRSLLAARTDRSAVPRWHIADPANPASAVNTVAYPAAGTTNVAVSLAIVTLDGVRVDVPPGEWEYLVAVHWSAGGPPLLTVQSRDQKHLEVRALDVTDGSTRLLRTEQDPDWVEIVTGVPAWTPDGRLVHVGVDEGAYRLFVDAAAVTGTDLQVRSVLDVGEEVLFSASGEDPTQIHVYRTEGGVVQRLSDAEGVHNGAGTAGTAVLASWSPDYAGIRVSVLAGGERVAGIASVAADPGLVPNVHWLELGGRALRAALVLPTGHEPGDGALPVLLDPYGGPHAQRVLRSRNAMLTPQWLADQGFAVLVVDGRGSPGRGPEWERAMAGDLGDVALADQVDALHAAAERFGDLDLARVAIRGWSFGGYLAAAAVLRRPDVFTAGVAGAPVTDWSLYDTHYTERYLGLPDERPEVYERNSLITDAPKLERSLLIVHGLADDNVFVAHALRLSSELLAAGRAHTFLPLAGATHMTPQAEEVAENLMLTQVRWLKQQLGVEVGA